MNSWVVGTFHHKGRPRLTDLNLDGSAVWQFSHPYFFLSVATVSNVAALSLPLPKTIPY
jgi:hypothetical protein